MKVCPSCGHRGDESVCPNDAFPMVDESTFSKPGEEEALVGQVFGERYKVDALIGKGGMGWVFRATHLVMQQTVALKVMRRELASDMVMVKRFYQEARACSRLKHHHSIKVHDFGVSEDGNAYLAMEYLDGRPLSDVMVEQSPFPAERACRILAQACKSLEEAHSIGLVHRDLKPANIFLVDMMGETDYVKVLDFGIAKIVEGDKAKESLTGTGAIVGTPCYMSPEQARGAELDGRSDLYSVGIMLYELLTRELPFEADSATDLLVKRLVEDPRPIADAAPEGVEIPAAVAALVTDLLDRYPDNRPATATDVRARLEDLAGMQRSPRPTDVTVHDRARASTVPTGPATVPRTPPAEPDPARPPGSDTSSVSLDWAAEPELGSRQRVAILVAAVLVLALGGVGAYALWPGSTPDEPAPGPTPTAPGEAPEPAAASDTAATPEPDTASQPPTEQRDASPGPAAAPTPTPEPTGPEGAKPKAETAPATPPAVAPSPEPPAKTKARTEKKVSKRKTRPKKRKPRPPAKTPASKPTARPAPPAPPPAPAPTRPKRILFDD